MSAKTQRDAIINLLNDDTYFGSGHAGPNYHILEQAPGVSIVVSWQNLRAELLGGPGSTRKFTWTMNLNVFVKDEGDTILVMERLHDAIDTIIQMVMDNPTLSDTCDLVIEARGSRNPGEARIVAGFTWVPFDFQIDSHEIVSQ